MTLIEVLAVIAVLLVLAVLLFPTRRTGKAKNPRIQCVNNLKQVGLSFRLWAGDNNDKYPMQVSMTNGGTMEFASGRSVFPHFLVMSNELNTPKILVCPADTARQAATNWDHNLHNENISYFVGLDANELNPNMLLSGDRNLSLNDVPLKPGIVNLATNDLLGWTKEIHKDAGNIGLADGSVQQVTVSKLRAALQSTGSATNRLAIP